MANEAMQNTSNGNGRGKDGGQDASPIQKMRNMLSSAGVMGQIKTALPPGQLTAERMVRVALTALNKTPALLKCTPQSICAALIQAAELGLEPVGALGHAYLVPYGSECQLIVGYRGMIALARRSGEILSIESHPVFEGDHFEYEFGLDPKLVHKPTAEVQRGAMVAVYAVAKLKGGGTQFDVMMHPDVEAIRNRSKAGNNGPWKTDYTEMARKTVIRRLFKYLPVSVELVERIEREDTIDGIGEIVQQSMPALESERGNGGTRLAAVKSRLRDDRGQHAQATEGSVEHPDGQDVTTDGNAEGDAREPGGEG